MVPSPLSYQKVIFMMINDGERINRINDSVTLIESESGLKFTTDAYLLSAYIRRPKGRKSVRAAELGAGTGVISLLAAARDLSDEISAFEVQPRFCDIIKRNVEHNFMTSRIKVRYADVREISELTEGGQFDFVFSNPPYMRSGTGRGNDSDEKNIARHEVFGGIDDFCAAAARLCKFGGMFYVVYRPERTSELFFSLVKNGFEPKLLTYVHPDVKTSSSLLLCAAKRGGKPGLTVTPPLYMYENGRSESEAVKYIYKNGAFPEEYRL